jgi:glutathione S-transferase
MKSAVEYLDYTDYLLDRHNWMAGATLSLADLAAAAQISVADYLGGIDWKNHEQTARWYGGMKSRPSFRPLLSERMEGIPASPHYHDVNF